MVLLGKWVSRWLSAVGTRYWSIGIKDAQLDPRSTSNASVRGLSEYGLNEDSLTEYTLADVGEHHTPNSCWVVLWDLVFDVTNFISEHPGSEEVMLEHAGTDVTTVFCDVGHSGDAVAMLAQYRVGILPKFYANTMYGHENNRQNVSIYELGINEPVP